MQETNQQALDVTIWQEQLRSFKALAKKYGAAMIILTLNNFISPFIFMFPAVFIGAVTGVDIFAEGTDLYYYAIMILNEFSAYAVPIALFCHIFKKERKEFIPDRTYRPSPIEAVLMFFTGMAAGALGTVATEAINSVIDKIFGTGEIEEAFSGMEPENMSQFGIFAFCICVVAPIAEEYIFRDLLLKPLRAYGDMTAAIITGLLFGLYHGNFDQFAYASLLGFFYSVIAVRHNSILPTVILHAANNIIVTISTYLPGAVEGESQSVQDFCSSLSDICSALVIFMMLGGIAGLAYTAAKKCFKLNNHNTYVPEPHALIDFVSVPWVIAGLTAMLVVFFI